MTEQPEFRKWPSTPRLFRDIVITEKIDGTNACVIVSEDCTQVRAQSRKRLITPEQDNYGFARWVYDNAGALADVLGPGYHYGEWWGKGIQRGYGLDHRRFSLFNVHRWDRDEVSQVDQLDVVPVLYRGPFSQDVVTAQLDALVTYGSQAAWRVSDRETIIAPPAEGVVIYHTAAKQVFKVLVENDQISKTEAGVK